MIKKTISTEEWKKVALITIIILLISQLPLILGYTTESENEVFMGIPIHVTDANNHLNWVLQAKEGNVAFANQFTQEDIPALIINPFHLTIGLTAKILSAPTTQIYNLFGIISIILFSFILYFFISYFIKDKNQRLLAFILTLTASGFGMWWKISKAIFGKWVVSADLWVTEMNTFQSFGHPHFIFSTLMILMVFYFSVRALKENSTKQSIYAGLTLFLLTLIHIFDTITITFVLVGWFLYNQYINKKWSWKEFSKLTIIGAITLPAIGYYFWVFFMNSAYKEWNSLNLTITPNLIEVISGFGLIFFFAAIYIWNKRKELFKKSDPKQFLIIWIVLNFILIYLPINVQRRFIMGLHIPLSILAAIGIYKYIVPYLQKNLKIKKIILYVLIILICSTTTIYLTVSQIEKLHTNGSSDYSNTKYLTNDEYKALTWLEENTNNNDVIVAPYYLSNYIPAVSGNKVYCGHWAQTINFEERCAEIKDFYQGNFTFEEKYYYYNKETKQFDKMK